MDTPWSLRDLSCIMDNGTQGEWNGKRQAEITIYIYTYVYMYIYDIFGPIIIQLVLRCTGAWLRRTGA